MSREWQVLLYAAGDFFLDFVSHSSSSFSRYIPRFIFFYGSRAKGSYISFKTVAKTLNSRVMQKTIEKKNSL